MSIKGKRNVLYDPVYSYPEETEIYSSVEFAVAPSTTNYDVKANTVAFNDIPIARFVELVTDQTIKIRFNLSTNSTITITAAESRFNIKPDIERLAVKNIFITNESTTISANIKLRLT
jgi:hypothetical protein